VGDVIDDRYELRRELGRGSAGLVFEAIHRFTHRDVAIKIVAPDVSYSVVGEVRARLIREARALAATRHPGIVDILDGGTTTDGTPYIVLEMLRGRTLGGLLTARGKLSVEDSVGVALQICDALAAAHKAGIVHRDLKPENIFAVREYDAERIKLVDFGIAQVRAVGQGKLTGIGAVIGTPEYMAPEQLLAFDDIDERADVYALGITMYECLTGEVPYLGTYQQLLLESASPRAPKSLLDARPEVGKALADVVHRAFAKKREDRFGSIVDLWHAIEDAVPGAMAHTTLLGPRPLPVKAPSLVPMAKPAVVDAGQRRRFPRAPYATPVRILLANGGTLDGRNEDISEGGMLLLSREVCAQDEKVNVRFALPMEGRVVSCPAVVRWLRAARPGDPESPRAIGLEFVDLLPEVRASIARYVELIGDPSQG
jgi:serine/threonine protein kinase